MRLSDTYRQVRSLLAGMKTACRVRHADLRRAKPTVERLEHRETPSAVSLEVPSLKAMEAAVHVPGVLVAAARLESLLLNGSLRNTRVILTNVARPDAFVRALAHQDIALGVTARDAWESAWFRVGRPRAEFNSVARILTNLQVAFIQANDHLIQLQELQVAQDKILPYQPPAF